MLCLQAAQHCTGCLDTERSFAGKIRQRCSHIMKWLVQCRTREGASREASNTGQVTVLQTDTAAQLSSVSKGLAVDAQEHGQRFESSLQQLQSLSQARNDATTAEQVRCRSSAGMHVCTCLPRCLSNTYTTARCAVLATDAAGDCVPLEQPAWLPAHKDEMSSGCYHGFTCCLLCTCKAAGLLSGHLPNL